MRPLILTVLLSGCVDPDAAMDPSDTTDVIFEVPKGSTAKRIAPALVEQGLVPSEFAWNWFASGDEASCLKAGKFALNKSMTMRELLTAMCGAPLADDVPFTVLEGWRIRDIDGALAAKGWIEAGAYHQLAQNKAVDLPFEITSKNLEGYLYPETYMVAPGDRFSAKALIERQLSTFKARFIDEYGDQLGDRSLHDVVVMASMIEREERNPVNRPLVAGILWKRIDRGFALGVDATSRYELDDWSDEKAFRVRLRNENDPYNSRHNKGMPPTAIGNPTLSALKAAINPKKSDFLYYLHDKQGVFHGGVDAAHHERNRAAYGVY